MASVPPSAPPVASSASPAAAPALRTAVGTRGLRGVDTVATIHPATGLALHRTGVEFAMRYLGSLLAAERDAILGSGLLLGLVAYANHFSATESVSFLRALAIPAGVTVWADAEAEAGEDPAALAARINAWAAGIAAAGYEPGLYVGPGCPLTSAELYALRVVRYWKAGGRCLDRNDQINDPACGYCMLQLGPEGLWRDTGLNVDVDAVQPDYKGRLPTFVGAAAPSSGADESA